MRTLRNLDELFVETIRRLYDAERRLLEELPSWVEIATDFDLERVFADELKRTLIRSQRLEEIGVELDLNILGANSLALAGLLDEARQWVGQSEVAEARDVELISTAQRVGHSQEAAYRAARNFARELGYMYVYDLLQMCIDDLQQLQRELTRLAEGGLLFAGLNEEVQI